MAQFSIGEVEQLTGVKAHVLRYWEEVIPSFSPKKDFGGRRVYSQRELDTIRRLKYLITEKGFTIEGARRQLIDELCVDDSKQDALIAVRQIRAELTETYLWLCKIRGKNEKQ